MLNEIFQIILGIVGLSIVVLIHEGGHYVAARCTGIRVKTFSIGFGRRLVGVSRGCTDYQLSIVPVGGYCRFYGEQSFKKALDTNMDYIPGAPGEFYSASPLKRIIVSVSGPLANILFAMIVLTLIHWIGFKEYYTESRIILSSEWSTDQKMWPADHAGLKSGDYIVAVDGESVDTFSDLRRFLIFRPGEEIRLSVNRNGHIISVIIAPELNKESGTAIIGVLNWIDPVVGAIAPESAVAQAGIMPEDRFLSINGIQTPHTVALYDTLKKSHQKINIFHIERKNRIVRIQIPSDVQLAESVRFKIISGRSARLNLFQAFSKGFIETCDNFYATFKGLRMLFLGIKLQNAVSGPMRLIMDTGSTVAEGFKNGVGPGLLWSFELMALISISLAFINLLPIPVLDGGQMILFFTEMVRHGPFNPKTIYRYQIIGTVIVLMIALAATAGDMIHFNNR